MIVVQHITMPRLQRAFSETAGSLYLPSLNFSTLIINNYKFALSLIFVYSYGSCPRDEPRLYLIILQLLHLDVATFA